jgi:pimeloyl-ACP methyl ester carboxylesterase
MRHPFDSLARAPQVHASALVLIGADDTLIPPSHSQRLADAWGGPVERVVLDGVGHNDVHLHPAYNGAMRGFLERCA